jgi:hypothetical protein
VSAWADYSLSLAEWQQESALPRLFSIEKTFFLLYNTAMPYKVVETSIVTDEELEKILNE